MLGARRAGASLSHAPGARAPRLAAPRLALLLREQPPSRAEPEAAPGLGPAAVAAARLTPGRAEPPARRRSPRLPAHPLAGRGASKARRAAEGGGMGRGQRAGGGAQQGAAGLTQRPLQAAVYAPPSQVPGTGDPGLETGFGGSGPQANWDKHPLGSCRL